MPRRAALALAALLLAAAFALVVIPYLLRPRPISAGTAAGPPQQAPVPFALRPGWVACQGGVALDAHTQVAIFTVFTGGRPAEPLRITASGPGFSGRPHTVPGGYTTSGDLTVPLDTPPHPMLGRVCIEDAGRRNMTVYGTGDSTNGRGTLTINGQFSADDLSLRLFERFPYRLASHAPLLLERAAAYKGPLVGRLTLWPLAVLVLAGLPVLALLALREGLRE
jgi:hypothetical protein